MDKDDQIRSLQGRVAALSGIVAGLTGAYVELSSALLARLVGLELERDRTELASHVADVMGGVAQAVRDGLSPTQFATPPGTIGVFAVRHEYDYDQPARLFLTRDLADQHAGGDPDRITPAIVWGTTPPRSVRMWKEVADLLPDADPGGWRTTREITGSSHDPDMHPDCLVDPRVEQIELNGGWRVFGYGPRLEAVEKAVDERLDALRADAGAAQ